MKSKNKSLQKEQNFETVSETLEEITSMIRT